MVDVYLVVVVVDYHGTNFLEGVTPHSEIIVGDEQPYVPIYHPVGGGHTPF